MTPISSRPRAGDGRTIADLVQEIQEAGERPNVAVLFVLDRRGNASTLERLEVEECTEEYISDTWGGGRFQVRMEGERGYLGSVNIRIASAPGAAARLLHDGEPSSSSSPPPAPAAPAPEVAELRQQMAEIRALLVDRAQAVQPGAPGGVSQTAEMLRMSSELAQMMVRPMVSMMEQMQKAKPATGGNELGAFLKGLRTARELEGGGEGGGQFGPLLMRAFDRLQELQLNGTPPQLPEGSPSPSPPPGPAMNPPALPAAPQHQYLQAVLPFGPQLEQLAASGADPGLWAAVIDERSPDLAHVLRESTDESRTQLLDALVGHRPALGQYRPWLEMLVDALVEEPDDTDQEDGDHVR